MQNAEKLYIKTRTQLLCYILMSKAMTDHLTKIKLISDLLYHPVKDIASKFGFIITQ